MTAQDIALTRAQQACDHAWSEHRIGSTRCTRCDIAWERYARHHIEKVEKENDRLKKRLTDALDLASAFTVLGLSANARAAFESAGGKIIFTKQHYTCYPPHGSSHPKPGYIALPSGDIFYMIADFSRAHDGVELVLVEP